MKYKYIGYIPTPRAGSTSFTHALINAGVYSRDDINDIPNRNGFFMAAGPLSGSDRMFPRWWENHNTYEQIYLFTIIRNPYERIVSAWLHSLRQKWIPEFFTLIDYCQFLNKFSTGIYHRNPGEDAHAAAARYYDQWPSDAFDETSTETEIARNAYQHGASWYFQSHVMLDRLGYSDDLKKAIVNHVWNGSNGVAGNCFPIFLRPRLNILRFENLQECIDELTQELEWPQLKLPHLNSSRCHDYKAYHTLETQEFVKMFYAIEIAAGGYEPYQLVST